MFKNKVIWLVNEYGTTPRTGYAGRMFYLAKYMALMGADVYFIMARHHHLINHGMTNPEREVVDGVNIISIPTMEYTKSKSKVRVFNWFIFNMLFI